MVKTNSTAAGVGVGALAGLADYLRAQASVLDVQAPTLEANASIDTLRGWADAVQGAAGVTFPGSASGVTVLPCKTFSGQTPMPAASK